MADDRRWVTNRSGALVPIDLGRDMDEATFDRMVEDGDLTPAKEPKQAAKKASNKK